jgi:hypothetical protein
MPIDLISKIKPKNNGSFPICEDIDIEGGYQVRTSIRDRDSIPVLNRKIGMLVYVQSESKYYTLTGGTGDENWVEASMGGGGFTAAGDLSGNGTSQTVIGLNAVPLPEALPTNSDLISAHTLLMLSNSPYGITSDGYSVWIADEDNVNNDGNYGGLVRVFYDDTWITTRYDYSSEIPVKLTSIAYHPNGYLYATGVSNMQRWTPQIYKIDPSNGTIIDNQYLAASAYIYVAGETLWITIPSSTNYLYKVDPDNISSVQLALSSMKAPPYFCGFAYDSDSNKIWVSDNFNGTINKVDPITLNVDITTTDYMYPCGLAYGNSKVWLTSGYNSSYGYGSQIIYALDPDDPGIRSAIRVTDNYMLLSDNLLISYDTTNNCLWCLCDGEISRLLRVNSSYVIDGLASLENRTNNSIISIGNYVWVVDNPSGISQGVDLGPIGQKSILKIQPSEVLTLSNIPPYEMPAGPWSGIIASITNGPLTYNYIKKNSCETQDLTPGNGTISNTSEITLALAGSSILLPTAAADGEKHTIIDAHGGATYSPIYIQISGMFEPEPVTVFTISNNYGAVTLVWSELMSRWYVISYWYEILD